MHEDAATTTIAGFPATLETHDVAGLRVEIWVVSRLEAVVDRESLLREASIPEPPYWAHLWVGARHVARRLAEDAGLGGATVLDLGCGLGLPGLVAGKRGAQVWFVDREPAALEFARRSAERNGLRTARFLTADFTASPDPLGDLRFDLVLGAEIVYEPAAYLPLAAFLDRHLAPGGRLWLTDAFRSDAARCFAALHERGLRGERRRGREWEDGRPQGLFLWKFRRAEARTG